MRRNPVIFDEFWGKYRIYMDCHNTVLSFSLRTTTCPDDLSRDNNSDRYNIYHSCTIKLISRVSRITITSQCHSLRRGTFEEPVIIDGSIQGFVLLGKADPNSLAQDGLLRLCNAALHDIVVGSTVWEVFTALRSFPCGTPMPCRLNLVHASLAHTRNFKSRAGTYMSCHCLLLTSPTLRPVNDTAIVCLPL